MHNPTNDYSIMETTMLYVELHMQTFSEKIFFGNKKLENHSYFLNEFDIVKLHSKIYYSVGVWITTHVWYIVSK